MKRIMHILLMMLPLFASAQKEKAVESKISHVTVFLQKAQVTREVKTRVDEGESYLVLDGLSSQLDPNSIQVSASGNFVLLGIEHRQNYLDDLPTPRRLQVLKDSADLLQDKVKLENIEKQLLDKEEQMLISNQKIGGGHQNLSVNELKSMAEFFRTRLHNIAALRVRHEERIGELNAALAKVQKQIRTLNELASRNTSEIVLHVSSKTTAEGVFAVDYIVPNAGWTPLYDLRALNTEDPLTLFYKANVFQRTGEPWDNVTLTLSTANPSQGATKPELQPWRITFYKPPYYRAMKKSERGAFAPAAVPAEAEGADMSSLAEIVTVQQTAVNTEFNISVPYTVKSASKPTTVDIGRHMLNASYRYAVAPKLDANAYLMAEATGWSELNLLPGEASIFFQGTYVGKTFIDPNVISDTLAVSLGRDKRVVVKRERLKNFNSHAVIGLNQKQEYAFSIDVRNNLSRAIEITVEDQVPVSGNGDIEVSLLDSDGAAFNRQNGKLVWQVRLDPNEARHLAYNFEVKFPRDKLIAGLN